MAAERAEHRADGARNRADKAKPADKAGAVPLTAPLTTRAPNCVGTLRLGVAGNLSPTSSTTARIVKINGASD